MSNEVEHKSHAKEYFIVFIALAVLTAIEVWVPEWSVRYSIRAITLVALAILKAIIVAIYYMHLKEETTWLKFIAAIPSVAGIYAVALMLEANFR